MDGFFHLIRVYLIAFRLVGFRLQLGVILLAKPPPQTGVLLVNPKALRELHHTSSYSPIPTASIAFSTLSSSDGAGLMISWP